MKVKVFRTIDEQILILQNKGMIIDDIDFANVSLAIKHGVKTTPTLFYNKQNTFNTTSDLIATKNVVGDTENNQIFSIEEVLKMGLEK